VFVIETRFDGEKSVIELHQLSSEAAAKFAAITSGE
jgi:hypothetical protein